MSAALVVACAAIAALTVAAVVVVAVLDWAHAPRSERLAISAIGAGLTWGAPGRLAAGGVGLGDLVLLIGVFALIAVVYGRRLALRADQLDGVLDGRLRLARPGIRKQPGAQRAASASDGANP